MKNVCVLPFFDASLPTQPNPDQTHANAHARQFVWNHRLRPKGREPLGDGMIAAVNSMLGEGEVRETWRGEAARRCPGVHDE